MGHLSERCANAFQPLTQPAKQPFRKPLPGEHLASVRRKRAAHSLVNTDAEIIVLSIHCYVNLRSSCLGVGKSDLMHRGLKRWLEQSGCEFQKVRTWDSLKGEGRGKPMPVVRNEPIPLPFYISISSPYAKNFILKAKKKSKSEMASAGSILGSGLWSSISGRLVGALPFIPGCR